MNGRTTYERIGGEDGVTRLVGAFYDRVLADPALAPFFAQVSMDKLRRMQVELFSAALGGPDHYRGQPLGVVHQGRGITKDHLRRFVDHLLATLETQDLSRREIQEICSRIALAADEIATADGGGCEAG
jgi:hemoglobin